ARLLLCLWGLLPGDPPFAFGRGVAAGDRRGVAHEPPAGPPDHRVGRRGDPATVASTTTTAGGAGGAVLVLWPPTRRVRQVDRRAGGVHLRPLRGPGDPAGRRRGGRGPGGGAHAVGAAGVTGPVQLLQPGGSQGAAPSRQRAAGACRKVRRPASDLRQVPGPVPGYPGRDPAGLSASPGPRPPPAGGP